MQPFEFPTFNSQNGSKMGGDQNYTSQYGEQKPQQNSIQGQHWQMPHKSYFSSNNYNQNQLNYINRNHLGGQESRSDIAQMGQWGQNSHYSQPQNPQEMNFLQKAVSGQQNLSWQNPQSGVNHFEYANRQNLNPSFNPFQNSLKDQVPQQFQERQLPHVKQTMNFNWPNQQASGGQKTLIQGQERINQQGFQWPNQQSPQIQPKQGF